jgi:serine/threonine protein kinase
MAIRVEQHAEPLPGYRLIERLGGGGFGEVWKAEAPGGLQKAIKFVFGDISSVGDKGQRADQELKALKRVQSVRHPYILSLERYDIIDGQLMIVMELADKNLWDRFKECRSQGLPGIPRDELLVYISESAEALDLMNQEYQLQHLDIKPQNIFLVHNHVKVADFGLVKDLEGSQASVTGGLTPVYAAPETFDGKVTRFSDQYSLAIVWQEMLTGQRPFNGVSVRQLIMQHISALPDVSSLPPGDRPAITRALSKLPDQRFPSCRDLVAALSGATAAPSAPSAEPLQPSALLPAGEKTIIPVSTPSRVPSPNLPPTWQGGGPQPAHLVPRATPPSSHQATHNIRAIEMPVVSEHGKPTQPPSPLTGAGSLFPALILGLGQVGLQALQRARSLIDMQVAPLSQLPHLRWLVIDTDPEVVRSVTRDRSAGTLSPNEVLLAPLNRPSHYIKPREGRAPIDKWLNSKVLYRIPRSQVTTGIRALGRLAFCDNYRIIARRLQAELDAALDPAALQTGTRFSRLGLRTNRPRVYVFAGLAGGTGGGMFLDTAYTLRALLRQMGYESPDVVGVLLVPPVDRSRSRASALANSYAALAELNHYGRQDTVFQAFYHTSEAPIHDDGPPFSRTVILPLPEEGDEAGTQEVMGLLAQFLSQEAASAVGKAADLARAGLPSPPWASRGRYFSTFGMFQLAWPRQALLAASARRLCLKTVQRWLSKDSKPIRDQVQEWVKEQWARLGLGPDRYLERLREGVEKDEGLSTDQLFGSITGQLKPAPARPTTNLMGFDTTPVLPPTSTEHLKRALLAIEELLGNPCEETPSEEPPRLVERLNQQAQKLAAEWSQKLAELAVHLIEEPAFRLAGAEEAIRQTIAAIEQALQGHEPLITELTNNARDAYTKLWAYAAPKAGQKRPNLAPDEAYELLRALPRWRFQSLMLGHLTAGFVGLRGHLSDELREINFCRVRLTELQRLFEEVPAEEMSQSSQGASAREGSIGQRLFLSGCRTLREAVELYMGQVTPEALLDMDARMEEMLRREFTALVHVCLSRQNMLSDVKAAMLQVACGFAAEVQQETSAAQLFFEEHPDDNEAEAELAGFYQEASPEISMARSNHGGPLMAEVCVVAAPEDEASARLRKLVRQALPSVEAQAAATRDDVVIYRERLNIPLTALPQMGAEAHDAYLQMDAANVSPHTRTDVKFKLG